jgi:arsenate reductase
MNVTLYGYPKCSTCREAGKWLEAHGIGTERIDLVETPPSEETLKLMIEQSGLDVQKFFNVSGDMYKEMKLKDKLGSMSLEDKLWLLSNNGKLIKRPIATDGSTVTVGFRETEYTDVWGAKAGK